MQMIVGVLRGGPSHEHDVSLKSGHTILTHLPPERYTLKDIFIDRQGVWYLAGRSVEPRRAVRQIDVALIGLHGEYGEDGEVQKILERHGIPYAGANSFSSFISMHKVFAKHHAEVAGLKTPRSVFIEPRESGAYAVAEAIRTFSQPVIVKPIRWGSSAGVSLVSGYTQLYEAVVDLLAADAKGVLVEEYIKGREASVVVVEELRNEKLYTPPPVEIVLSEGEPFFSHSAKYSGKTREVCPAPFQRTISDELMRSAKTMHESLGIRHYSRSDFIVAPDGVYYLETNTLPGLTEESILPKALASVGVSLPQFLEHLIHLARTR